MSNLYRLTPDIGPWFRALRQTLKGVNFKYPHTALDPIRKEHERISELRSSNDPQLAKYEFLLSCLRDLLLSGGSVGLIDSQPHIAPADFNNSDGADRLRRALQSVEEQRPISAIERHALEEMFLQDMTQQNMQDFISSADFWLHEIKSTAKNAEVEHAAFRVALRFWSMPYRGREGRRRRFLVFARNTRFQSTPVVAGIIEIGDDSPFNYQRDNFLTLRPESFSKWLDAQDENTKKALSNRYQKLRLSLKDVPPPFSNTLHDTLENLGNIKALSAGRSNTNENLYVKKRLTYLYRLAIGEAFFSPEIRHHLPLSDRSALTEAVRAMHDLTIPRVHMEATVCGAVPPFSQALGGKLVTSFLGHPTIQNLATNSRSTIVSEIFRLDAFSSVIPNQGLLALTTKGLYPDHSAQYNRVKFPGNVSPVSLGRVGKTDGESITLYSDVTAALAKTVCQYVEDQNGSIANIYGSGGSKRQRFLEKAAQETGLDSNLMYTRVKRPIYGLSYVRNAPEVIWLGAERERVIDPRAWRLTYDEACVELWRHAWLEKALNRLGRTPIVHGLATKLGVPTRGRRGISSEDCAVS